MGECTAPNNRLGLLTELLRISISFLVSTTELARIYTHDKPASGFSRGVDKSADVQQKRRHQEPSHSKLLHVRVMRSLSLRNLIREGSWISCPATPDALSSEAFSWAGARDRPLSPSPQLVGLLAARPVASSPKSVRAGHLATHRSLKRARLRLEVCRSIEPGAEGLDDRDRVREGRTTFSTLSYV